MKNLDSSSPRMLLDWKWVIVGYCFLVIFHLFPSYVLIDLQKLVPRGIAMVWMAPGICVLSFVIAYRSRGITLVEPTLSSFFYFATCAYRFGWFPHHSQIHFLIWSGMVVILSAFFAVLGDIYKVRKRKELVDQGEEGMKEVSPP